jgi:4-hydroxybenzoate polyprenyltransferase
MLSTVRTYASFVKFSHTVFALPFAIAGMVAAYAAAIKYTTRYSWGPAIDQFGHINFSWSTMGLILVCMVSARTFAMALNRLVDREIDALNPRTAQRELPSGKLSARSGWALALISAFAYFGSCFTLGQVVFVLSPIPLAVMWLYPYTKRFTASCHFVLGISLGFAPIGAWVAVRGMLRNYDGGGDEDPFNVVASWRAVLFGYKGLYLKGMGWGALTEVAPWLLAAAVALWVAGFDIIYALQDEEFDRHHRLRSIPAALGRVQALRVSRLAHALGAVLFSAFVFAVMHDPWDMGGYSRTNLAPWVWAAPCVMLVGMVYQHSLVKPDDLSRVNVAFFTVNGVISVIFGAIFVAAWLLA